jgi:Tat protein secretion system quality control protein TatD with DNase activity
LADRIAYLTNAPALRNPLSPSEIIKQFKTFHYDTASCGTSPAFDAVVAFVPEDKLLIGTDHPYAAPEGMAAFAKGVDEWKFSEGQRKRLYEGNAVALFPRLG